MQIPVRVRRVVGGSAVAEWSLIELQGGLSATAAGGALSGQHCGDLHFDKQGKAILIIGHHMLSGKEEALAKPLGVLLKSRQAAGTTYDMVAMVKRKLIFKTRPKPIVTCVPKKV